MICSSKVAVYSISTESFIRSNNRVGNLSRLASNEYYTFVLNLRNNGTRTLRWEQLYVVVDNYEAWHWCQGSMPAGQDADYHIYYCNMQKVMKPGRHTVTWYMDGQEIFRDVFVFTRDMDWAKVYTLPSRAKIAAYTNPTKCRSPYIAGWFNLPAEVRYTEYAVDFKADYLPKGTYCCLGNWVMDYSSLEARYKKAGTEYGISGYAGFQNIEGGEKVSIMSFGIFFVRIFGESRLRCGPKEYILK